jgi:hypothetical protein
MRVGASGLSFVCSKYAISRLRASAVSNIFRVHPRIPLKAEMKRKVAGRDMGIGRDGKEGKERGRGKGREKEEELKGSEKEGRARNGRYSLLTHFQRASVAYARPRVTMNWTYTITQSIHCRNTKYFSNKSHSEWMQFDAIPWTVLGRPSFVKLKMFPVIWATDVASI